MSLLTFLEIVLAVWVGNNLRISLRYVQIESVKLYCTVFDTGFMIIDSTVKHLVYENYDVTQDIINKVKDRNEWHLHIGKYYVFYITPSKG